MYHHFIPTGLVMLFACVYAGFTEFTSDHPICLIGPASCTHLSLMAQDGRVSRHGHIVYLIRLASYCFNPVSAFLSLPAPLDADSASDHHLFCRRRSDGGIGTWNLTSVTRKRQDRSRTRRLLSSPTLASPTRAPFRSAKYGRSLSLHQGIVRGNSDAREAGYIRITKEFRDNKPLIAGALTAKGSIALKRYVEKMDGLIKKLKVKS